MRTGSRVLRGMVFLIGCSAGAAEAGDTNIRVDYVIRQERVRPQPQTVRPRISMRFVLRQGGAVDVVADVGGKHPEKRQGSGRLGTFVKVIDERTLSASWSLGEQRRTLTITTEQKTCSAKLEIAGSPEFSSLSTDLNQMAHYRNPVVESITCQIE